MPHRFALAFLIALLATAPIAAQTFVFELRGDQEVPPVVSSASGGCMGTLDQAAAQFTLTCVHNVLNATVAHIHRAPAGANGGIAFDLGNPASPITATWSGMTASDMAELLEGGLYLNIHTAGRPSGEIRGQILPRTVDMVAFTASGSQVVPPNGTPATASCTADLNDAATSLAIQCTHNVAAPVAAHIHEAPARTNGPVVFTFPSAASPLNANMPMTPRLVADFAATFLYLDIHAGGGTEEDPADEIRGQIGTPPTGPASGRILIRKSSFPAGGTGFHFTETITPGSFTLNDPETRAFDNVVPGTYTVTESVKAGYTLADVACNDADSTADTTARNATIRVDAGEVVTCTFRNFETVATDDLFVFHLSGDQEVPAIATTERGGCMGRFDRAASELSLVCTHNVELPSVMHIHRAPAGQNGPIAFDLGRPDSPVVATWSGMTPADVADLFAGNLYVNIHTAGRPSGVIRGQILQRTVDTVAFTADSRQVVPPGDSSATASCTANLGDDATQLAISCTHNVPSPEAAHVHQAPRGKNGPIVYTLPSPISPMNASMTMTPRLVADFAATFLYLDIHGPDVAEDGAAQQIRGQIAAPVAVVSTGTIRVVKSTSPAGGTGFAFTDNIPGSTHAFTLDDGGMQTFANVTAGTYTVTESLRAGYSLTDVSCNDGDSSGNPFNRTATIRLQGGDIVTCTFRNLQSVTAPTTFVFDLSGSQEVPPNGSSARGGCFGQLDQAARSLSLVCTHNVSDPTVAHIHRGAAGVNGEVVFDLGSPASPIEATWTNMTPAQVAELLAGNYYVNIHAGGRPAGEIRGQILPRTVDAFSFPASGDQEVPPTDSTAQGDCVADLAANALSLHVRCSHDVDNVTSVHLHDAPPGRDGPAIFDFTTAPTFAGDVPLTPRTAADFAAGFLYVNIHSADYAEGEIRGQLIAAGPAHLGDIPTLSEWMMLMMILSLAAFAAWRMR
jgi:hypothetical protein